MSDLNITEIDNMVVVDDTVNPEEDRGTGKTFRKILYALLKASKGYFVHFHVSKRSESFLIADRVKDISKGHWDYYGKSPQGYSFITFPSGGSVTFKEKPEEKPYVTIDGVNFWKDGEKLKSHHINSKPRAQLIKINGKLWFRENMQVTRKFTHSYTDCYWIPLTTDMLHHESDGEGTRIDLHAYARELDHVIAEMNNHESD